MSPGIESPGLTNLQDGGPAGGGGPEGEHALVGPLHTLSGGTPGHYLQATGASTFAFTAIALAHLPAELCTDADLLAAFAAHAAAGDPHGQYILESEKGAAGGVAPLDGAAVVPGANLPAASETVKGVVELAAGGETGGGLAVQANDPRLTDARDPTAHAEEHEPGGGDPMAVDAAAGTGSLRTLGTGAQQAAGGSHGHAYIPTTEKGAANGVATLDAGSKVPDGQIPTAITRDTELTAAIDAEMDPGTGHDHDGTDSKQVGWASIAGKPATFPPEGHAASHANGGGDELNVAGLSGTLADPQTPADHAAEHGPAGGDALKLDDLAVPDDNPDLNALTTRHGLLPKLSGSTAQFLRGDGAWAAPPGGGGAVWGAITGTLSDQTDLDAALDSKATPADIAAAIGTHEGAADPHVGYQKESEKGAAGGYASLDGGGQVPDAQMLASLTRDAELAAAITAHEAAGDPHPGYATDGDLSAHTGAAAPHSGHVQIGGQLGNTPTSPDVRGLRETSGPTNLAMGAVADGEYLRRSGATVIGGTPGGGGGADPLLPTEAIPYREDFIAGSPETGELGDLGWTFTNGSIVVPATPEANHPGHITRRSGTTAAQVAILFLALSQGHPQFRFDQFDTMYFIGKLVTTGTDFSVRFGIQDLAQSNPGVHGVYIERLAADTSWFGVSRNGSVQTRTAALLAQDTVWHKFRIRRISATQVGFSVDGGTEVTISASNIPDAADAMKVFHQIIPTTTTARDHDIDFVSFKLLPVTR